MEPFPVLKIGSSPFSGSDLIMADLKSQMTELIKSMKMEVMANRSPLDLDSITAGAMERINNEFKFVQLNCVGFRRRLYYCERGDFDVQFAEYMNWMAQGLYSKDKTCGRKTLTVCGFASIEAAGNASNAAETEDQHENFGKICGTIF